MSANKMIAKTLRWAMEAPGRILQMYESSAIDFKNNSSMIGGVDVNKTDSRYTVLKSGIRTPQTFYKDLYNNDLMSPGVEDTIFSPNIARNVFKLSFDKEDREYELLYIGTTSLLEEGKASANKTILDTILYGLNRHDLVSCQEVFGKYFPGQKIPGMMLKSVAIWITTENTDGTTILGQMMESFKNNTDAAWRAAGHSLGAALVQVHALLAALMGLDIDVKLYGAYAIYDSEAAEFFDKLVQKCVNYQFMDDPITSDMPETKHVGKIVYANCGTSLLPGFSHSMKHYATGVWFGESLKATATANEFMKVWSQDPKKAGKTAAVTTQEVKNLTGLGWF